MAGGSNPFNPFQPFNEMINFDQEELRGSIDDNIKEIAKEIAKQCEKLSYFSPWFATSEPSALLAKKIATLPPKDLNTVFFTTCGSTALDSAVRFVHYYFNCINKSEKKLFNERKKITLKRKNSNKLMSELIPFCN